MKSTSENEESRSIGGLSTSSMRNRFPRSISAKQKPSTNPKPSDPNVENTPPTAPSIHVEQRQHRLKKQSVSKSLTSKSKMARLDSRDDVLTLTEPPKTTQNPAPDFSGNEVAETLDPPVKVVVRIKPEDGQNRAVRKVSSDSLFVGERKFTFDSILDSSSSQQDIFQSVGVPLVKNALAGYNTTLLACGQTGSGKTYTMWGPPSAMLEEPSPSGLQGIVPRIFQMLFSKIQREGDASEGKHTNYQCRCSFLEIYNEQIGDLLDPRQRNLEIKDEPKNGMYIENLTEEYVNTYEEVAQILMKGLSSRKLGATSINSKSSRSHVVFTFILESWHKGTSSKCYSTTRTSRISLVDLAGPERNKLDDAGRPRMKEEKFLKKSLSHLGRVTKVLTGEAHSQTSEGALFRGSCLTHLLKESLGGNAKLTVICAISPDNKNTGELLSTLRFGQRVKVISNKPLVNEISEDDVNDLSDQIRQLKDELLRAKTDVYNLAGSRNGHFRRQSTRESLNQLRISLNRSLILPDIDNDDEEVKADVEDIQELHQQFKKMHSSYDRILGDLSGNRDSIQSSFVSASSEPVFSSEEESSQEMEGDRVDPGKVQKENQNDSVVTVQLKDPITSGGADATERSNSIAITPCCQSSFLQEPILSESPKVKNTHQKRIPVSSSSSSFLATESVSRCSNSQSFSQSELKRSSLRSSKISPGPPESLAASLQRGLQIIDYHQTNSMANRSSVCFSFEHLARKPCKDADKANASSQNDKPPGDDGVVSYRLCPSCRQKFESVTNDDVETHIAAVGRGMNKVARVAEDNTERSANMEDLENKCMDQAAKIEHLSQLLEEYKRGKENQPFDEEKEGPVEENKLLNSNEVKDYQHEVTTTQNDDIKDKEELLKEIGNLKCKLRTEPCKSPRKSVEKLRSSLLSRSMHLRKSMDCRKVTEEQLEKEREEWMELESEWISLTDELRVDIETQRRRVEELENEVKLKKNYTDELEDAIHRAVLGHARFVEHYTELQEKYNDLDAKHRAMMEGIAEVKRAATRAGSKGCGSRFAKSLVAQLSALRLERESERNLLKKENKKLKIQLRDTVEAVHAAGELLVRLREAEQATSVAEEKSAKTREENDRLKKQIEKLKKKHKMEMITMKQYLAESKLPEPALQSLYRDDSEVGHARNNVDDDDQEWRAEFGAIYQNHY